MHNIYMIFLFLTRYYFIDAKIAYDKTQEKDRTVQLENRVRDWLIGASSVTVLTVCISHCILVDSSAVIFWTSPFVI